VILSPGLADVVSFELGKLLTPIDFGHDVERRHVARTTVRRRARAAENCRWRSRRRSVRSRAMDESLLAPRRAWALLQDGRAQLIDLRGQAEIDVTRIPGARAIRLDQLPHELATLDRERPVVLVSGTGRAAAELMQVLRSAGITASAVEGGMRAWLDAELPVETGTVHGSPPPP